MSLPLWTCDGEALVLESCVTLWAADVENVILTEGRK